MLALYGSSYSGGESVEWADPLLRSANYFHGRAAYTRAEKLARAALAIHERALGPEHPDTVTIRRNLTFLEMLEMFETC